jgi:hypothetical protein
MHDRAANPRHFDWIVELFRAAGLTPQLVHRPLAFDPTMSAVREGSAVTVTGASLTSNLAPGLLWIPLDDPAACMPFELVLRERDPSPAADRFVRIAVETATAEGWLDGSPA